MQSLLNTSILLGWNAAGSHPRPLPPVEGAGKAGVPVYHGCRAARGGAARPHRLLHGAPEEPGGEAGATAGTRTSRCQDRIAPKEPPPANQAVPATALSNSCAKWCNYHLSCQMASRWSYLSHQRFNKLLGVTFAACPPPVQPPGL